jgi:hypothetical protein
MNKREVNIVTNNNDNMNKIHKILSQSNILKELLYQMKHTIYKNNNEIKKEIILPLFKTMSDVFFPYIIFTYSLIFLNLIIVIIILFIILTEKNN